MLLAALNLTQLSSHHHRLYKELSFLWPLVSPPAEYKEEAAIWTETLRSLLGSGRHNILELGVGGGHLLSHLKSEFHAVAADISESMVALSSKLNPEVEHHLGDMRHLRLNQRFDAVLIHDAVSYLLTEDDLKDTLQTAKSHLDLGGVLLMAPDWFQETFSGTQVLHWVNQTPQGEVTCIEYVQKSTSDEGQLESIFFYLWKEDDQLRIEQDRHLNGLFSAETWLGLMREAGFSAQRKSFPSYDGGYGGNLLIGRLSA